MTTAKNYTRKEFFLMEKSIADFHTSFYITAIQNIAFHLPHVHILGTNYCGNTRHEALKCCNIKKYMLCCCDYAEGVVASFKNQIRSEYYVSNIYVSIEGIALENFGEKKHI